MSQDYEDYVEQLTGTYGENSTYGTIEELKGKLAYKRVVEWDKHKLVLDDGTVVTIECSEWDCCAHAGGTFSNIELDAAITDVNIENVKLTRDESDYSDGEYESTAVLKLYHNQNSIAQADVYANAGNGGYYYSVASLLVKDVFYKIVQSGEDESDG